MPTNSTIVAGKPCWLDLVSSDLELVKPFYQQLFGWDFAMLSKEFNNYHIISGKHGPVAGAMQHNPESMGAEAGGWDMYFTVDDLAATTRAVESAGGKISVPPHSIENQGSLAFAEDPNGTYVGFWQPGSLAGFAAWGEHGYPAWFELHTRDFEKSMAFYNAVLPVSASKQDMPGGMVYSTLNVGEESVAGIWDINEVLPVEMPADWNISISVDDCAATCAKARELGGTVVMDPEETEHGHVATIQDPAGATISVISPVKF